MAFGDEHTLPETTATAQAQQQQQGRGIVQAAKDMAARALEVVSHAAHETPKPIGMDEAVHQQPDDHPERQAEARAAIRDAGDAAEEKATEWKVAAADALGIESADAKAYKAKEHAKAAANDAGDAIAQKADEATGKPSLTERLGEWKDSALRTVGLKESEPASSEKAHQAKEKAFEAGSDARDAVALKAEETKESAIDAKDRLSEKAAETYDRAKEAAIDAKDRVAATASHAYERTKEAAIDTKDAASAKLDDAKARIHDEADRRRREAAINERIAEDRFEAPDSADHIQQSGPTFTERIGEWKDAALRTVGLKEETAGDKAHRAVDHAKDAARDAGEAAAIKADELKREAAAEDRPSLSERVGEWKDSALRTVGLKKEGPSVDHPEEGFHDDAAGHLRAIDAGEPPQYVQPTDQVVPTDVVYHGPPARPADERPVGERIHAAKERGFKTHAFRNTLAKGYAADK